MKYDTAVVIVKATCYVIIGAGTPMATALAQWANSGEWPEPIQWVNILIGACVGGATQLLSFMSGSWTSYTKGRTNGNADTGPTDFFRRPIDTATPPQAAAPTATTTKGQ